MRAVLALGVILAGGFLAQTSFAQESQLDGLKDATRVSPFDAVAALRYGRALREAGQPKEAATELRRGAVLPSGKQGETGIGLRYELARTEIDQRNFWGALAACGSISTVSGASAAGHACMAEDHLLRRRGSEALLETAQALAHGTRSYEAKVAEGLAHELEVDDAEAEASFREAIAWVPDAWEAHAWLGRLLVRQLHREEGTAELRRAVELDPNGPVPAFELACTMPVGPDAATLFERAARERPTFALAWMRLADVELELGRIEPARRAADAVAHLQPSEPSAYVVLGRIALADGKPDDALREGQRALGIQSNSARAKLLVADAFAAKGGDIDLAIEAYEAAYGLDPSDPASLVRASVACHSAGRDTSARAFAEKATQDFVGWGPGWVALGDALVGQRETAGAKTAYETALRSKGPVDAASLRAKISMLR